MTNPIVRPALITDLHAITDIYNDAVLNTVATFDTEPRSHTDQLRWFHSHNANFPINVAESDNGITGWASLSKWSGRCAYDKSAELSFYVRKTHQGKGIGKRLIRATIDNARRLNFHTLIAVVSQGNDASLHMCGQVGFVDVGTLKEVGRKFGKWLDVRYLQKMLD